MADRDLSTSDEVWFPIPGIPGYELSSEMRVRKPELRRKSRHVNPWRILKIKRSNKKLAFYYPGSDGKRMSIYLHRAVAMVAYGPVPDGLIVRHYNDDATNNYASNLCFGTYRDNAADKERNGHTARGERCGSAKLTDEKVRAIRFRLSRPGESAKAICREFGVSKAAVFCVRTRRSWTHIT